MKRASNAEIVFAEVINAAYNACSHQGFSLSNLALSGALDDSDSSLIESFRNFKLFGNIFPGAHLHLCHILLWHIHRL